MPSLQSSLPPELADSVIRLYRECLRRAKYIGHQEKPSALLNSYGLRFGSEYIQMQHNTALVVDMVRQQFKRNMHETDPEKIEKMKDDAARGLINHTLYESERLSGRKFTGNPKQ